MITHYHRPQTLEEALKLLAQPNTVPLGGGTLLSKPGPDPVEVVDLQRLSLDSIRVNGNELNLGATVTLQALLESDRCTEALKQAIKLEAPLNIRNSATVAGTLVSCDGRSTFTTMLLAMDAKIEQAKFDNSKVDHRVSTIGDFLPLRPRDLISSITIPLHTKLSFEYVSRTPADKPIVCVAAAGWVSGRRRLAAGGYGKSPMLAMDGTSSDDPAAAASNAFHEATDDFGSAEYRMDVAATLAKRCMSSLA
jgi:putative selenate reductase FAD-binding subunit